MGSARLIRPALMLAVGAWLGRAAFVAPQGFKPRAPRSALASGARPAGWDEAPWEDAAQPAGVLVQVEGAAEASALVGAAEADATSLMGAAGLAGNQLSLTLCDEPFIHALNVRWRGVDKPTDVLSFPMDDETLLGDVVICVGVAERQAAERDHAVRDELRVLLVHGLLHLLGYDHEGDDDAAADAAAVEMAEAERTLFERCGWSGEGLVTASARAGGRSDGGGGATGAAP